MSPQKETEQTILNSLTIRPPTVDDLGKITKLLNARSRDILGTQVTTLARQKRQFQSTDSHPQLNSRLVSRPNGEIVGYLALSNSAPHIVSEIRGAVHPHYRGQGIGTYLLQWAEQRARELIPQAPAGARVVLHGDDIFNTNYLARDLFVSQGYTPIRHFIHLRITMTSPPPEPIWPEGITVRPVVHEDWPVLGLALDEAFQDHWGVIAYEAEEMEASGEVAHSQETDDSQNDETDEDTDIPFCQAISLTLAAKVFSKALILLVAIAHPPAPRRRSVAPHRSPARRGAARHLARGQGWVRMARSRLGWGDLTVFR